MSFLPNYDLSNTKLSDQENFQKKVKLCEERWVEFCRQPAESFKIPTIKPSVKVTSLYPESYSLYSMGNCLYNLCDETGYDTKLEVDVNHLIGKKRRLRAIKNIEIQRIPPKKRRKTDKSDKLNSKKDRRKEHELVLEHNSAFSLIMPYLLTTELKFEFNDCFGSALNESAIATEQLVLADCNADFDIRPIIVLREQEPMMLLQFLERCHEQKEVLKFIREYCLYLLENLHFQWTVKLKSIFQKLWTILINQKIVNLMISDDLNYDLMKMNPTDIVELVYDFRGFLYLTELEVDQEMVRRGLRLGPSCLSPGNDGRDSLDASTKRKNMMMTSRVERMFRYPLEIFPLEEINVHLRILWLDAKLWILKNNSKYMLKRLNHINECMLVKPRINE